MSVNIKESVACINSRVLEEHLKILNQFDELSCTFLATEEGELVKRIPHLGLMPQDVSFLELYMEAFKRTDFQAMFSFICGNDILPAIIFLKTYSEQLPSSLYWKSLRHAWEMAENINAYKDDIRLLFDVNQPDFLTHFMKKEERKKLMKLPQEITIYRGCLKGLNESGFSWSLSKDVAEKFSRKWARRTTPRELESQKIVLKKKVNKSHIKAILLGRGEEEVILLD